ncbi:MAG TPA: glycosyltransferase [Chthoniobacterales bacterium]|jgi:MGT family glycosyltransferase|nr:glycosyltransferase [Chthoniobacterales bacterium]
MKIGFICPNVPGHMNPMTALAHHLQARNHEVVFLYSPNANGLPCVPGNDKSDEVNATRPEVSKLSGWEALEFYIPVLGKETEKILKSLPRMLEKTGVEALVLDPIQFFVELGAIKLGVPYVSVAAALYLDYSGHTPLCVYGWPHETTPEALSRNRKGVAEFLRLVYTERTKAYAKEAGIKLDWDAPTGLFSQLAYITQVPEEFDFENPLSPPQFYHTGPFYDANVRPKIDFPWERLTGEPLIYASMGTILNGQADVFRRIVAGVAKHKGTQLVLSIGDQLDPKDIGTVPDNAIVVKKAPQVDVLKRASVCITHAGLNTVLESLACGVPQVAFPVTFDQPGIGARIAAKKTGVTTEFEKLTPDHLSTLLDEVLNNSVYRENARNFQKIISKTNGLSTAADIVERSFGVNTK